MGRLVVLVTSPRLPAGLLTAPAWSVVASADLVAAADVSAEVPTALAAAGIGVVALPGALPGDLVELAADRTVVWLSGKDDGGLPEALTGLASRRGALPRRTPDVEVEVVVGSYDPAGARLLDAVAVMDRLRQACPWDRQQTHDTLVPYLIEEAYEVLEAIETGDRAALREELGDLLFQVLFHARVAAESETDPFTVDEVAGDLVDKLVRRHPHVFAGAEVADAAEVGANWDEIKRAEKGRRSVAEGIPLGQPALSLAAQLVDRALRARADLSVPVPEGSTAYTQETLGEVLFALVAAARAGGLDPERALRARVRQEMAGLTAVDASRQAPDVRRPRT